jgi:hypothetical protein
LAPAVDDTGDQLLKHARIYTLAEKYGVDALRTLASSKIHCINSTAKGEIAYARYVYAYTDADDTKVRAPIASFWATRSHTLRSEAEAEFKALCLEYPQFGYDVLSMSHTLAPHVSCSAHMRIVEYQLTMRYSSRAGRQAQERPNRQNAPCYRQWPETCPSQQRRNSLIASFPFVLSCTTRSGIH